VVDRGEGLEVEAFLKDLVVDYMDMVMLVPWTVCIVDLIPPSKHEVLEPTYPHHMCYYSLKLTV